MTGLSVVLITKDRTRSLQRTLDELLALPEGPEIVVVDNGSRDGTAATVVALQADHPRLRLVCLDRNLGAPARNIGVTRARGSVIAFCDDDSWWEPGSLARAQDVLRSHPDVGVVVGRVRLWPDREADRVSRKMGAARLGRRPDAPGPDVISFPAFAAVVRRDVFEGVGGFSDLLFFGGEERLFALDVAAAGRRLCYLDDVVAWHAAESGPLTAQRWALHARNDALVDWMRRPLPRALRSTSRLAAAAMRDRHAAAALLGLARRLPRALAARRPIPAELEAALAAEDAPLSA